MRNFRIAMIAMIVAMMASASFAQTFDWLEGNPDQIQQDGITEQVEALLKLFSALSGSGFINTAALHQIGGVDVRFSFMGAPVPEKFRDIIAPPVIDPLQGVEFVPFAVLHGNLGLAPRLEAYGRFFTLPIQGEPGGNVTLVGGGLKFGVLRENLDTPALTLMGGYQTILVPEAFDFGRVSSWGVKAYISKAFPVVTLYGGGGLDRTALKLTFAGLPPDIKRDYSVTYPQATAGLTFTAIPFVKINLDANLGEFFSLSAGAALSIR